MEEDRLIFVVLPRNYETDAAVRYPVLYKLDGGNQLGRYVGSIEVLNSVDAMPEMIVVAIPNARNGRERDLTPPVLHQQEAPDGAMGSGEMGAATGSWNSSSASSFGASKRTIGRLRSGFWRAIRGRRCSCCTVCSPGPASSRLDLCSARRLRAIKTA